MLNQAFTVKGFQSVITAKDFRKDKTVREFDNLLPHLTSAENDVRSKSTSFSHISVGQRRGKDIYKFNDIKTGLILNKANDNLSRVFKVKQTDRTQLIRTISTLLSEDTEFFLIKADIKNFYESLPKGKVLNTIFNNQLLSEETKWVIRKLFETDQIKNKQGLPRGIGLSATISEIYLKLFDQDIKRIDGVYYYGRFVDDFVIFTYSNPEKILTRVDNLLNRLKLSLNLEKTKIHQNSIPTSYNPIDLNFLGYHFQKENTKKKPKIRISKNKVNKIKTRIVKSLISYGKNPTKPLLTQRIKFLTSNYHLKEYKSSTPIKAGIYYNYPLAEDCLNDLESLDNFLRNQIFSKNNIPAKMGNPLSKKMKKFLSRYSFYYGFKNKIEKDFTAEQVNSIKECWDND